MITIIFSILLILVSLYILILYLIQSYPLRWHPVIDQYVLKSWFIIYKYAFGYEAMVLYQESWYWLDNKPSEKNFLGDTVISRSDIHRVKFYIWNGTMISIPLLIAFYLLSQSSSSYKPGYYPPGYYPPGYYPSQQPQQQSPGYYPPQQPQQQPPRY